MLLQNYYWHLSLSRSEPPGYAVMASARLPLSMVIHESGHGMALWCIDASALSSSSKEC